MLESRTNTNPNQKILAIEDDPEVLALYKTYLQKRGYEVEWHTWPMPHSVCGEEIEAVSAFLGRIFGGGGRPARSSILLP